MRGAPPRVDVAVAIDDRYAPHFAACVASIAASRGSEDVRFFLLRGSGLSALVVDRLTQFVDSHGMELVEVAVPDDVARTMPTTRHWPSIIWHRLLVPTLLPDLERIIVLDADVLVLQSLVPLFEHDLAGHALGAVGTRAQTANQDLDRLRRLGIDPDRPYLNTGVMLMDLEAMRADAIGLRTVAFGRDRADDLLYPEQDALNAVLGDRWMLLPQRWNALSHLWLDPTVDDAAYPVRDRDFARSSPAIVHFEGHATAKPWFYRCVHPMRFLYRDLRATTPWPLQELEGRSVAAAVLRTLPPRTQFAIAEQKRLVAGRIRRR